MSELKAYLCIEAKTIEQKDFLCYRFTSATKSAPEACMEDVYLKSEADEVTEEMKRKLTEEELKQAELLLLVLPKGWYREEQDWMAVVQAEKRRQSKRKKL